MRKILRAVAWSAGALVLMLVVAGGGLYFASQHRLDRTWSVAGHTVPVPTDSLALERGRHVAFALSKCADCHRTDLGGGQFIDEAPVARLYAPNLTRGKGGIGAAYTDLDWERAIRHAVRPNGDGLLFMPSLEFQFLSDDDVGALIAYLKALPPVDRESVPNRVGPIGRALYMKGDLVLVPAERVAHDQHPTAVPMSVSAEYGKYLAEVGGCTGCHGEGFSGGKIPGTPPDWKPASNITPTGIGHYKEEDFFRAMREGVRPGGAPIDSLMPFRFTKLMTDDEIRALYLYLRTVPAKPFGGR
ncbi:MAG: cytochrome c [Gemmatimonadota bacterium]|nr:cytochrome c [Gemmatimonadota bacterium]